MKKSKLQEFSRRESTSRTANEKNIFYYFYKRSGEKNRWQLLNDA